MIPGNYLVPVLTQISYRYSLRFWVPLATALCASAIAQQPATEDELSRHLTTVRAQIENAAIDMSRREDLALDMASTLDRSAQSSTDAETRRRRWAQAVELLDWFLKQNPNPPRERQVRFQAAVYCWAQAQSWSFSGALAPGDPRPREEAKRALDDAIERYRSAAGGGDDQTLGENLKFRLAEALAARSEFDSAGSTGRRSRETEALALLEQLPAEAGLAGYWHLLKADLLRGSGKLPDAQTELDAAVKSTPPPPDAEIVEIRVPLLLDLKKFDEAVASVEATHLGGPAKALWAARARLAQLAEMPAGAGRFAAETDLFRRISTLRKETSPESRRALLELARADLKPDAGHPAEIWDDLAAADAAAGEPVKAAAQMATAAERAAALGQSEQAATFRLRRGGFLFQAGKLIEASALLGQVVDSSAPVSIRAKAGILRALALGRAVALGLPGSSRSSYIAALEQQLRNFPGDPSTGEVRWLLGRVAAASSEPEEARAIWSAITAESARWLDSRLALIELDREQLELEEINPDRHRLTSRFQKAEAFAKRSLLEARSEPDKCELMLAAARLDLTPGVGRPEAARDLCERVSRLPGTLSQLYRARLLRLAALVEAGRYVDAEREAHSHTTWRLPTETNALFDVVRLLDQLSVSSDTDLRQRRFGLVNKLLVEPLITDEEKLTPEQRGELAMRLTRSLLAIGADRDARLSLDAWRDLPQATTSDRLLRDLGDTYQRLEIYSLDVDVQRLRLKNNPAGSPRWFDARYALALAYFHSDRLNDAAKLIDSTAILHPDLGGGPLHDKFIRLRQRLGVKP
jgi:hypothetical protein